MAGGPPRSSGEGGGDELVDTSYMLLDMTPKGRNENGPDYNLGDWVRRHDEYEIEPLPEEQAS